MATNPLRKPVAPRLAPGWPPPDLDLDAIPAPPPLTWEEVTARVHRSVAQIEAGQVEDFDVVHKRIMAKLRLAK